MSTRTKLSGRFWCALTLFSLIGQIAWVVENMYLNIFIYEMFRASAADISRMVAASAVSAAVTTVFIGALSDRIGKRKLFICGGYILWGVSIFGFALSMTVTAAALGILIVIALDCLMTFFGSSANDAAFNAWLTDSTDETNRGSAEGINSMMPLCAILAVFGGFMFFDLTVPASWTWIFCIIGSVVLLVGILGLFLIKEPKSTVRSETGYWSNVIYGFRPATVRKNPSLYFHFVLFILFNISIQIFMPYLILYYEKSLGLADYVLIMAPAIVLASVVTAIWGKVYDKKGFSFSVWIALGWLMAGYLILFFFRTTPAVFAGSLLMMCGYLSGMAVFGAKIRDLTPEGRAGRLQGIRITSQVLLPGLIGPAIGSAVLANAETVTNSDGTTSFIPNANIFLAALLAIFALVILLLLSLLFRRGRTVRLSTPFEESATGREWEEEYPRPQMKRNSFRSLSGEWELSVLQGGERRSLGIVRVPFPPESELSGIGRTLKKGERYLYERRVTLTHEELRGHLLLHFGAVDQIAEVSLNGILLGRHEGGYLPFSFDLCEHAHVGDNLLSVTVTDQTDTELCYGKQRKKRGGMWYTPTSGIWQPVWLERVPKEYIRNLRLTPTLNSVTIETEGGEANKKLRLILNGEEKIYTYEGDSFTLVLDDPILWSPEHPHLYSFILECGEDRIESYFALRTFEARREKGRAACYLNGKPYFIHGLLDQGYFSDGIYLPATPEGYAGDVRQMKSCGFNALRKHIKIEPAVFYYECDRQGMLVLQDMVNNGKYHFLADTVLPTVGFKQRRGHRVSARRRRDFECSARGTVSLLYNHPSVVYYTIFNEGWGQYAGAERIYRELKELDPTRVYDTASGWFIPKESDVQSEHVYFKPVDLSYGELPVILSEFGGYSCKLSDHAFNLDKTYGYKTCADPETLQRDLEELYRSEIVPAIQKGLAGAILTQVSDVEDETNGLLTYDRKVLKVDPDRMRKVVSERIFDAFEAISY
ncbi:MAG: MFS transporter, partial [Clostridia bacterium]|nr:MFS transporter [Clostridia bacterium]